MPRPTTRYQTPCRHCGELFWTIPSYAALGRGLYCSLACRDAAKTGKKRGPYNWDRPKEQRMCAVCGTAFDVGFGTGRRDGQRFCSRECHFRGRYRRGTRAREMASIEAAYLAGIVDGEGSIIIRRHHRAISARLTVTNCDRRILTRCAEIAGMGPIMDQAKATETRRASFHWQADGEGAESILLQIRGYLAGKVAQAELAIETQERLRVPALKADHAWQDEYRARMQELNRRGPRAPD